MQDKKIATLYVVATPIGNLADMSPRAIQTLQSVDWIACEDTRHSSLLFNHFGIKTKTFSLHKFNEADRLNEVLSYFEKGDHIALVSDSGTPLISDPGFALLNLAIELEVKTIPIPGPTALISALSISGLPTDSFQFVGFLPAKTVAKQKFLETIQNLTHTLVFYEAPHRLLETLELLANHLSTRKICIAREMTKVYESIYRGTCLELYDYFKMHEESIRGEIVIILEGKKKEVETFNLEHERVLKLLLAELPLKQAVLLSSKILNLPKNELYQRALLLKND